VSILRILRSGVGSAVYLCLMSASHSTLIHADCNRSVSGWSRFFLYLHLQPGSLWVTEYVLFTEVAGGPRSLRDWRIRPTHTGAYDGDIMYFSRTAVFAGGMVHWLLQQSGSAVML
jgi:hypothetical protein